MKYFSAALASAVFISLAALFAPTREGPRRACLSALSVLLLLALIPRNAELPLKELFLWEKGDEYTAGSLYYGAWQEGIEEGIKRDLCAAFDLEARNAKIECSVVHKGGEVTIQALSLTLTGKNIYADATGLVRYIERHYGCEAAVHLKGG